MQLLNITIVLSISLAHAFAQTAAFPGAIVTDAQLPIAVNNIQTSLAAPVGVSDTSISVASSARMVPHMLLTIESEIVQICSVAGNTLTVGSVSCPSVNGRGWDNSIAASHPASTNVYGYMDAWHYNAPRMEIKAIETSLGVNLGNVTVNIASGTQAMHTSLINSGACDTLSANATGVLASDAVVASFNGDTTGAVGYQPLTTGMLAVFVYASTDHVNFKVCNPTSSGITPGSVSLNWRVGR